MGLVKGSGAQGGALTVVVDEDVFMGMAFRSKVGLAKTFECAIAGPGKALADVQYVSHRSNKRLARWYWGELTID